LAGPVGLSKLVAARLVRLARQRRPLVGALPGRWPRQHPAQV